jgi:hypothetical protein
MNHLIQLEEKLDSIEFGYTKHGTQEEIARAKSYGDLAKGLSKANSKSPGMAFLKATSDEAIIYELLARKQAYRASKKGIGNLKAEIPFVGMGASGRKKLAKLQSKKK